MVPTAISPARAGPNGATALTRGAPFNFVIGNAGTDSNTTFTGPPMLTGAAAIAVTFGTTTTPSSFTNGGTVRSTEITLLQYDAAA
ncbi:hypothetical protein ASE63_21975 [Bosea sp. Root381]|uniref:hypothetical protein n=1 Tax=Bosea sp. Root381 TaxID=1736524 RepID=UPI0006F81F21|nr:hypothetical protein [Bosea sp. Root381]KRE08003.1 hypothetical protein ASE63_21975 [Bosea sp. Root381]